MIRAATLAVGTEITDGQIIDRNSAWLSAKLVSLGFRLNEHRAVRDDRLDIERALNELSTRTEFLFVTGGLGPTSDDFTRDLIAKVFSRELEFDAGSWEHICQLLQTRGITAREIQRQQCYFPRGARVLTNPAGTANAFMLKLENGVTLYALPGPPSEISAVWEKHLADELSVVVPSNEREQLRVVRILGRGESQIAEIVEEFVRGKDITVGYRAHLPYIEVKLWFRDRVVAAATIVEVEKALAPWTVNFDDDDCADPLLDFALRHPVQIEDEASAGHLFERLLHRARERKIVDNLKDLQFTSRISMSKASASGPGKAPLKIELRPGENENWRLSMISTDGKNESLEVLPPMNYKVGSERGRKFITEKTLIAAGQFVSQSE